MWWLFGLFCKTQLLIKNCWGYFFTTLGQIRATFKSSIRSHWCGSMSKMRGGWVVKRHLASFRSVIYDRWGFKCEIKIVFPCLVFPWHRPFLYRQIQQWPRCLSHRTLNIVSLYSWPPSCLTSLYLTKQGTMFFYKSPTPTLMAFLRVINAHGLSPHLHHAGLQQGVWRPQQEA